MKNSKIIIGLTGPIASGKGTIKKYIEEKYGAKECRFSSILRDVLTRLNVEIKRENLQKISTVLRQAFGEDALAKAIAADVVKLDSDMVVVDGVRRMTDIVHLKNLSGFVLVKVDADPKIRYERMKVRNENKSDDKKTFDAFLKDHLSEADGQVPEVMKNATNSIENSGSLKDLYKQVDNLIKKIHRRA